MGAGAWRVVAGAPPPPHLLDLVAQDVLHEAAQRLHLGALLLLLLLLILGLVKGEALGGEEGGAGVRRRQA